MAKHILFNWIVNRNIHNQHDSPCTISHSSIPPRTSFKLLSSSSWVCASCVPPSLFNAAPLTLVKTNFSEAKELRQPKSSRRKGNSQSRLSRRIHRNESYGAWPTRTFNPRLYGSSCCCYTQRFALFVLILSSFICSLVSFLCLFPCSK